MAPAITWGTLWAVHLLGTLAVSSLQHCVVHGAGGVGNVEAPDNPHHYGKENILQDEGASRAGSVIGLQPRVGSNDARSSGATSIRGRKTGGTKNRSKRRLQPWRNRPRSEAAWAAYLALAAAGSSLLLLRSAIRGSLVPVSPSRHTMLDLASKSIRLTLGAPARLKFLSRHSGGILSAALITAAVLLTLYIVVHSSTVGSINVPGRKAGVQSEIQRTPSATAAREYVPNTSEPGGNGGKAQAAPADPHLPVRRTLQPKSRRRASTPSSSVSSRQGGSSQRTHTKPTQDDGDAAGQAIAAALKLPKEVVQTLQRAFVTIAAREQIVTIGSLATELRPLLWLMLGLTGGMLLGRRLYWALNGNGERHAQVQRTPGDTQALAPAANDRGKAEERELRTGQGHPISVKTKTVARSAGDLGKAEERELRTGQGHPISVKTKTVAPSAGDLGKAEERELGTEQGHPISVKTETVARSAGDLGKAEERELRTGQGHPISVKTKTVARSAGDLGKAEERELRTGQGHPISVKIETVAPSAGDLGKAEERELRTGQGHPISVKTKTVARSAGDLGKAEERELGTGQGHPISVKTETVARSAGDLGKAEERELGTGQGHPISVKTETVAPSAGDLGKAEERELGTGHNSSPAPAVPNLNTGEQLQIETRQAELNRGREERMDSAPRGVVTGEPMEKLPGPIREPGSDASPAPEASPSKPTASRETEPHVVQPTATAEEKLETALLRALHTNDPMKALQGIHKQGKKIMRKAKHQLKKCGQKVKQAAQSTLHDSTAGTSREARKSHEVQETEVQPSSGPA